MPKSGTPYEPEREILTSKELYEDIATEEEAAPEQLADVETYDKPVPVRLVDDSRPKQSIKLWRTTRMVVPSGRPTQLLGYQGNRQFATVRNEQLTATDYVYLGPDEMVNDVTGYRLAGSASDAGKEKTVNGPMEIWCYHSLGTDVTVQLYWEIVTEIGDLDTSRPEGKNDR